jgi:hypothetical protein
VRFAFRDRQVRYLTDDLELLVMDKLVRDYDASRISPELFQRCLVEARGWPSITPIPWL